MSEEFYLTFLFIILCLYQSFLLRTIEYSTNKYARILTQTNSKYLERNKKEKGGLMFVKQYQSTMSKN